MRVLVTGATGFIGRHALPLLASGGHDVYGVRRRADEPALEGDVVWRTSDLLDARQVDALMETIRPTHLLHYAWYAEPPFYWSALENLRWLEATLHVFRRFAECGGERAVLAGTCAEYDMQYGFCSESLTPLRPQTLYGASKHAVQSVLSAAAATFGVSMAWGRIFFVYGPLEHPSRLVAAVTRALLRGYPAPCSHGRQVRDFLHSQDVASAFVHLLESAVEGPVNIASGTPVLVRDVATAVGTIIGRPELVRLGAKEAPPDEPPVIVADVRRLRDEVGWEPRLTLESGLVRTVEWWRANL